MINKTFLSEIEETVKEFLTRRESGDIHIRLAGLP